MTKKEIGLAAVSGVVLIAAVYFMYTMLFPKATSVKSTKKTTGTQSETNTITGNFDEETLSKIKKYKDYGEASLDNIGRVNPFGPLN